MVAHLRRDLAIRHLVSGFNLYDVSTELICLKAFFQLILCLTRAKEQNELGLTNTRNHRIIV